MTQHARKTKKSGLTVLQPEDKFRFLCKRGLECYTKCCRDITIFLTPYDIIRMKTALDVSSEVFLRRYTITLLGDKGLPVVILRLCEDEDKSCPFVTPEGCTIYENRPWSCRIYPLQPESTKSTEKSGRKYFSVLDIPFCRGFAEDKVLTVMEWKEEQGIPIYEEMEQHLKRITMNERLIKNKITNKSIQDMYYMSCYDLDRFRRFVFESKFLQLFEIASDTAEKIKHDDAELYKFAMKWLEYGLLGQHVLKVRPEVVNAKKEERGIR
jgi:Fe-S-cluster containining protein